jgi:inhibitor of cysteine peptidase
MQIKSLLFFVCFVVGLSLQVASAIEGKNISVNVGNTFLLELPSNPTTGFDWHFDNLDEKTFQIISSGYTPVAPQLCGSGGKDYWTIKALKPGNYKIKLLYYRTWEGKRKAAQEAIFNIKVMKKRFFPFPGLF